MLFYFVRHLRGRVILFFSTLARILSVQLNVVLCVAFAVRVQTSQFSVIAFHSQRLSLACQRILLPCPCVFIPLFVTFLLHRAPRRLHSSPVRYDSVPLGTYPQLLSSSPVHSMAPLFVTSLCLCVTHLGRPFLPQFRFSPFDSVACLCWCDSTRFISVHSLCRSAHRHCGASRCQTLPCCCFAGKVPRSCKELRQCHLWRVMF